MSFLSDRIGIIEDSIEALSNIEWGAWNGSIRNSTEFENTMDSVSGQIQELKRFSTQKEISDELDKLKRSFYEYSTLTSLPLEQEKLMESMREIVNKLKKSFL